MENRITYQIPAEDLRAINDSIEVLNQKLAFLKGLSAPEIKEIPKMAEKTIAFVEGALGYAKVNPDLCPPIFDLEELEKDMNLIRDLKGIYIRLSQLTAKLDDTMILVGSEAYQAALVFYNSSKMAARRGWPGSVEVYNDLKIRFER